MEAEQKYKEYAVLKSNEHTRVCLAEHVRLGHRRIMKTVYKSSTQADTILREALLMKQLKHPCIPEIYDIEERDDCFSVIEEYIPGKSFSSYLQKHHLILREILDFSIQLCELFEYLHGRERAVLHLDLKPDNLIIRDKKLYLIDFGSAKEQSELEDGVSLTGTPGYAAPECYRGWADTGSDLFGIGKLIENMLVHCVCTKKQKKYRSAVLAICRKATSDKSADRYRSATEMKYALMKLQKKRAIAVKNNCLVIGLAGAGRRVGATWFALSYLSYLKKRGWKVLYLECNASGIIGQLREFGLKTAEQRRLLRCNMAEARGEMNGIAWSDFGESCVNSAENGYGIRWEHAHYEQEGYQVILADFGALTTENREMYLETDIPLLFGGGHFWEEENLWKALSILTGDRRVELFFSFLGKQEFAAWTKRLKNRTCRRVPYVDEEKEKKAIKELHALFEEVTELMEVKMMG